tara:strand:- start:185 stop:331 length:147 start_codon:yes stop_codon:yes gene_type:complete
LSIGWLADSYMPFNPAGSPQQRQLLPNKCFKHPPSKNGMIEEATGDGI